MRRLNPKSILILSVEWLKRFIFPIILSVFANGRGSSRGEAIGQKEMLFLILVPAVIGLLAILGGVISYTIVRFGIVNNTLLVKRGGLWKQERTIPLERIQNVRVTQGLMERMLGIATLQVETASGSGVEASLKSLSVADAEYVKEQLLQVHAGSSSEPEAAPAVYEASFKDIALAGALQNRALIVTVAILGLFGQGIDDVFRGAYRTLEQSKVTEGVERNPLSFVLIATGAVIVFILIGWLLSIAYAVTVYHGFRVVRTERGLQVSHGLLNTVHTVIPLRRIQSVQTSASWLYRLLGLNQLYIQSIGGHQASQGGPQVAAGQTLLAPICRPDVLRKLIELINPALQIDKVNFLASDRYLLVRKIVKLVITNLIIFGGCAAVFAITKQGLPLKLVAFAGGAFTLLGVGLSTLSYRKQSYARTPEAFMVCNGTLGQNVTMIPVGNIQAVTLESSWFLRRRGLVDLHVSTPVSVAIVPCITRETGIEIKDDLIQQSFGHKRRGI